MTEEVTNPDLRSQDERQLDLIRDLNSRVPSNPQGDAADAGLKKILQSLSKNSLSDALRDSFSADKLKMMDSYVSNRGFPLFHNIHDLKKISIGVMSIE